MPHGTRLVAGLLAVIALGLPACDSAREESAAEKPATVEAIAGSSVHRVRLIQKAADRLGIQTATVRDVSTAGGKGMSVPYSALIYDPNGATSVYTNPEHLVFVKHPVAVDRIVGNDVFLSSGPPVGTRVVTVGASELVGIEFGIGEFE